MVAELAAALVVVFGVIAESLHARRCRRVAHLAFGPTGRPAPWARVAPFLRVIAAAAICWGLVTLFLLPPQTRKAGTLPENRVPNLLLVLDVSPSMRLQDAGPTGKQSRAQRAADLLKSFFERTPPGGYRTSIVAFYTEAKPVVLGTTDLEVVRNFMQELPMSYAFEKGTTNILAGLAQAARTAQPWSPRSTTMIVFSDGDTVPATGMPKLPASIAHTLVVGVGDARVGRFIDGHQSRQDASTLRQVATRLGGTYHDGNEKQLPSDLIKEVAVAGEAKSEPLTLREYALMACGIGAAVLAGLPVLLHKFGTSWRPGVRVAKGVELKSIRTHKVRGIELGSGQRG